MTSVFLRTVGELVAVFDHCIAGKIQPAIDEFKKNIGKIINTPELLADRAMSQSFLHSHKSQGDILSPTIGDARSFGAEDDEQRSGQTSNFSLSRDQQIKDKIIVCLEQHQRKIIQLLADEPVSTVGSFTKFVGNSGNGNSYLSSLDNLTHSINCLWEIYQEKQLIDKPYNEDNYYLIAKGLFANYIHHNRVYPRIQQQTYLGLMTEVMRDKVGTIKKEQLVAETELDLDVLVKLSKVEREVTEELLAESKKPCDFMFNTKVMEGEETCLRGCNILMLRMAEYAAKKEADVRGKYYLGKGDFAKKIKECITDMQLILSGERPKSVSYLLNPDIKPEVVYPSVLMFNLSQLIKIRIKKICERLDAEWWQEKKFLYYTILEQLPITIATHEGYSNDALRCTQILQQIKTHQEEYNQYENTAKDEYTDFLTLLQNEISSHIKQYIKYALCDVPVEHLRNSCLTLLLMTLIDYQISSEYKLRYDSSFAGNTRATLQCVPAAKEKLKLVKHIFENLSIIDQLVDSERSSVDKAPLMNIVVLCILISTEKRELDIREERNLQSGYLTKELKRVVATLEYHNANLRLSSPRSALSGKQSSMISAV